MRTNSKLLAILLLSVTPALAQNAPAPAGAPATGRGAGRAMANPVPDIPMPAAPYHVENNWAKLPGGRPWGAVSGIAMDKDGKSVWVFERCGGTTDDTCKQHPEIAPIMKFDEHGNLLKAFGAGMFSWPHGIFIDRENHVWVVDSALQEPRRRRHHPGLRPGRQIAQDHGQGRRARHRHRFHRVQWRLGCAAGPQWRYLRRRRP